MKLIAVMIIVCLSLTGCAFSARAAGQKSDVVEVARLNAEAIKALAEAIRVLPVPTPVPTVTPCPLCEVGGSAVCCPVSLVR